MMIESTLRNLGSRITRLRIARNLKQSELAYEAGISERTLQRMEAGEVVRTDGLLKVITYLDRLDALLDAIDSPSLSPYELATRPGKGSLRRDADGAANGTGARRMRVRTSKKDHSADKPTTTSHSPGKITWPEDQT